MMEKPCQNHCCWLYHGPKTPKILTSGLGVRLLTFLKKVICLQKISTTYVMSSVGLSYSSCKWYLYINKYLRTLFRINSNPKIFLCKFCLILVSIHDLVWFKVRLKLLSGIHILIWLFPWKQQQSLSSSNKWSVEENKTKNLRRAEQLRTCLAMYSDKRTVSTI